ncbi:response regulator transcription factor [Aquirufa nivalisilvae]|uniref:Response regulator transcription factor n=2 Tax=Aquirufa TaxID=2676247 RepID=A0ABT4JDN1_9BACT|nr:MULTISPECIES: response regulator transcription factor [Aquirufa]MCZ2474397.1 response regulator transcription factor [Aquirufa ecclesiirivi]MCZ2479972.1 response regulator transcription factor [Aquirufa nivalisilvae]MCZ2482575.1 response regulator transcription factor [Aquirufa nivalisilvae]MDF0693635.1 response regulator transcription factor [Aquirufa ecclesiirivi]NGZ43355.1 response regulator transcription factor [Aquirufa beregesia]
MRILLIEDEPKTVQSLKRGLEENNYEVEVAYDGLMGKQLATRNTYQLIVSDIIIPGINGIELCKELRSLGIQTPILMLTALSTTDDKLIGFEAGADDYLAKPFDFKEFMARVKALIKRSNQTLVDSQVLKFADLELDLTSKLVTRSGQKINLTAKEFQLLEYFLKNQEKVISKAEIAENIWEVEDENSSNLIEVYVNYLRKKVDKNFPSKLIHTQFGMGYILRQE